MLIESFLFCDGAGPSLQWELQRRLENACNQIREITDLDKMTNTFCEKIIGELFTHNLELDATKMEPEIRTERLPNRHLQHSRFYDHPGRSELATYSVVRLSIPFKGDGTLFRLRPSIGDTNPPRGQINREKIEFDVVYSGQSNEADQASVEIRRNLDSLDFYIGNANKNINTHNKSISDPILSVFKFQFDKLSQKYASLESLGIRPAPLKIDGEPKAQDSPIAKVAKRKAEVISIVSQTINYNLSIFTTDTINQFNHNTGNVNNEIHSDE